VFKFGSRRLYTLSVRSVFGLIFNLQANGVSEVATEYLRHHMPFLMSNTDLVAGKYEGGMKVWESTEDLVDHCSSSSESKSLTHVLDLGCGGGLAGINALLDGAINVHFADFNAEVLQWFTVPNVMLNLYANDCPLDKCIETVKSACVFMPGDWSALNQYAPFQATLRYDLVLSAETIYSTGNYEKLLAVIQHAVNRGGKALIAGKSHYFGVGGSTLEFETFVNKDGKMTCSTVKQIESTVSREILELKWKSV
jgi:predicted nicotinamide N-methyase